MNWPKLKSQFGRTAVVLGLAGGMLGGFGAAAAQAAVGSEPGDVSLSPASGPTSGTPTWSTTVGCNSGFQGSAVFRIVTASGGTFSISPGVASVAAPFSGTLQDPISLIQSVAGTPNGGTAELVVYCFSGASLTGTSDPEMSTFLTFSADGSTYSTSGTQQVPVGEIGGLVFAGLAAVGLVWMQFRRRARRAQATA
jgi:hypothetical protein